MGRAEQFKIERKFQQQQQQAVDEQRKYRNKIFLYGFGSGFLVAIVISAIFFQAKNKPAVPGLPGNGSTINQPLNIPNNVQLPQSSGGSLQIQP